MEQHYRHGFELWRVALTLALVPAAVLYLRGWMSSRKQETDSAARLKAFGFILGLFLIWLAIASPFAMFDHHLLTAHMAQHLVLMTLAAPAVWLGDPVKMQLKGLPRRFAQDGWQFLTSQPIQRVSHYITRPAICWLAGTGVLIAWHVPSLFALGLQSDSWHAIEQISFLLAGLWFWWPVIRPWPSTGNPMDWNILVYLFLATLPCDILSGFLVFCDRIVYRFYESSSLLHGLTPLEDQQCAGALMWVSVTIVYLVAGTIYASRLLMPLRGRELHSYVTKSNA